MPFFLPVIRTLVRSFSPCHVALCWQLLRENQLVSMLRILLASQAAVGYPVDCSQLVAPVDRSPQRSPQAVHSVLASRFHGLDVVEIGMHEPTCNPYP